MTIPRLPATTTPDLVLAALEEHGLAVIERFLDGDDVRRKKADIERVLAAVPTGRNSFEGFTTRRVYALFAKTRAFDAQAVDPLLLAVVERMLGPGFLLSAPTAISIGPHGSLLGYVDGRHPAKFLEDTRAVEGGVVAGAHPDG
ncbi:MAG TPA: hypothetical protein VMS86_13030 [Thermoanaerobaculia bacterium]|nr:hypothetical protein [Thermoanaerobaculia bacterium]